MVTWRKQRAQGATSSLWSLFAMRFSNTHVLLFSSCLDVPQPQLPTELCSQGALGETQSRATSSPSTNPRPAAPAVTSPQPSQNTACPNLFSTFPTGINFLFWEKKSGIIPAPVSPELCPPGAGGANRDLVLCAHSTRATGTRDTATKSL